MQQKNYNILCIKKHLLELQSLKNNMQPRHFIYPINVPNNLLLTMKTISATEFAACSMLIYYLAPLQMPSSFKLE